jgi:hypothetical protein
MEMTDSLVGGNVGDVCIEHEVPKGTKVRRMTMRGDGSDSHMAYGTEVESTNREGCLKCGHYEGEVITRGRKHSRLYSRETPHPHRRYPSTI